MRRPQRMSLVSVKLKKDNFQGQEMKALKRRIQRIALLNDMAALWGWFDSAIHTASQEDGKYITLAYLAYIHNTGYEIPSGQNVPARPVLTMSLYRLKDQAISSKIAKIFGKYCVDALLGKTPSSKEVVSQLAQIGRDLAQSIMGSAALAPVSESTLKERRQNKSNDPLVDTGELRDEMRALAGKVGQRSGQRVL